MRACMYREDHQMFSHTMHFLETDCPLSPEEMSKLTWKLPGAGRFSVPLTSFKKLLEEDGYTVNLITEEQYNEAKDKAGCIVGATGNY